MPVPRRSSRRELKPPVASRLRRFPASWSARSGRQVAL